jgi:hypothetical protein
LKVQLTQPNQVATAMENQTGTVAVKKGTKTEAQALQDFRRQQGVNTTQ